METYNLMVSYILNLWIIYGDNVFNHYFGKMEAIRYLLYTCKAFKRICESEKSKSNCNFNIVTSFS